jgi:hypothetical protein
MMLKEIYKESLWIGLIDRTESHDNKIIIIIIKFCSSLKYYKCVRTSNNSGKKLTSNAFFKKATPEEPPVPFL